MAFEFKLPDIGEGLVEGEIVKWLVKEGDSVQEDQPLVEVMTDKATVEITSPRSGRIAKLLASEGDVVAVDAVFVLIDDGSGDSVAAPKPKAIKRESAARQKTPSSTMPTQGSLSKTPGVVARTGEDSPFILPPIPTHRVLAAPAVRKLAKSHGIDITTVRGSAKYGRIVRSDIENIVSLGSAPATSTENNQPRVGAGSWQTPAGPTEEKPLIGMRKRIAEQMVRSKTTAPHFTYVEEVDMTPIFNMRKALKNEMAKRDIKVTFLPFIFKAAVDALKEYPLVNASLDDARQVIVLRKYYNVGLSVATDDGLIVPVIKNVDTLDGWQIAAEIARLSQAARDKKIKSEELRGSTFTITSVGNIGGVFATPIINHPEAAIMGVNKIRETPVVRDGEIAIRQMMYLSTSFDHRLVDGDVAANFTKMVVDKLQQPEKLMPEFNA